MKNNTQKTEDLSDHMSPSMAMRNIGWTRLFLLSFFGIVLFHSSSCSPLYSTVPRQRQIEGGEISVFQYARPETVGISSKSLNAIGGQIEEWVRTGKVVGAEWLVIKNRKIIIHEVVGWKDREENVPMTINTIFRIRSMTKPFVGTSILMLMEEGKLKLSDPVAKFLPSFSNEKSVGITIKHLLSHTGGFAQLGYRFLKSYNSLREAADSVGKMGPPYQPGTRFLYSGAGSAALGAVVAEVSGMPLEDFIQTRILSPLGMTNTFCNLAGDDLRRRNVSGTYVKTLFGFKKYWDNSQPQVIKYFRAAGGMYSTPIDYAKFLLMWMDKGNFDSKQFLAPDSVRNALECEALSKKEYGKDKTFSKRCYGMMWCIILERNNDELMAFGHSGSDGTIAWAVPKENTMVFYFTQSKQGSTPGYFGEFMSLIKECLMKPDRTVDH